MTFKKLLSVPLNKNDLTNDIASSRICKVLPTVNCRVFNKLIDATINMHFQLLSVNFKTTNVKLLSVNSTQRK